MLKACLVGAFLSLAGVATAEPVAILADPSETIIVAARAAQMTVFFDADQDHLDVTMVFADNTGDILRSGVKLADNQSHAVTYNDDDSDVRTRFMVERVGQYVGVHVIEMDGDETFALKEGQARTKVK